MGRTATVLSKESFADSIGRLSHEYQLRNLKHFLGFWIAWLLVCVVLGVNDLVSRLALSGLAGTFTNFALFSRDKISMGVSRFLSFLVMYSLCCLYMMETGGFNSPGILVLVTTPFYALHFTTDLALFVSLNALTVVTCGIFYLFKHAGITPDPIDLGLAPDLNLFLLVLTSLYQMIQFAFLFSESSQAHISLLYKVATQATQSYEVAHKRDLTKHQFISTMSHEVRTPLNSMFAAFQLMNDLVLSEEGAKLLQICRTSADQLLRIVNNILDALTVESGVELKERPFAIIPLFDEICELYRMNGNENKKIFEHFFDPAIPPFLVGDTTRLRQIIQNLLNNAFRFTPVGGKVELLLARTPPTQPGYENIQFIVKDSGIGIPAEHIELIFDSFYQVDPGRDSKGGTGLGLGIVMNLVDLIGGNIHVESEVGVGSSFIVDLSFEVSSRNDVKGLNMNHRLCSPVSTIKLAGVGGKRGRGVNSTVVGGSDGGDVGCGISGSRRASTEISGLMNGARSVTTVPNPDIGNLRVMVVDDNTMNQTVLRMLLMKLGVKNVSLFGSGKEALKAVRLDVYDVIFLDLHMPNMNGLTCTKLVKEIDPDILICCVSASVGEGIESDCYAAGLSLSLSLPPCR
eukprot:TRINITY_DN638_c0_g1_i1.p1 TRINITY_DN638_c0_g1~~TRINITY_DN638_c0_g1_i1.p1  ORF type:complete len:707 (+),score=158.85 TRINITY_DN638_c0_g1_i1:234-2123(+)